MTIIATYERHNDLHNITDLSIGVKPRYHWKQEVAMCGGLSDEVGK